MRLQLLGHQILPHLNWVKRVNSGGRDLQDQQAVKDEKEQKEREMLDQRETVELRAILDHWGLQDGDTWVPRVLWDVKACLVYLAPRHQHTRRKGNPG
ncbi:hypothetical protein DV515_00001546 [Chloebia gouldiae]|uniref:Uncharacterized protein n=1 Tax=Chloebia gouldiae TaxID=44316 RepID=A0A3L8SYQ1_CHLGU|nr:hypothetical protein DV515_00001546 [Chloebia gouldiae]